MNHIANVFIIIGIFYLCLFIWALIGQGVNQLKK